MLIDDRLHAEDGRSSTSHQKKRCRIQRIKLSKLSAIRSNNELIDESAHTVIIDAEGRSLQTLTHDPVRGLLRTSANRNPPIDVFILLQVDLLDENIIKGLLDYPNLSIIHTTCHSENTSSARIDTLSSASVISSITQMGLSIPVMLCHQNGDLKSFTNTCKQWTITNRGSGLIITCNRQVMDAESHAQALIHLYDQEMLPIDRLVPMSEFVASFSRRKNRLPVDLLEGPNQSHIDQSQCMWQGLRGHRCETCADGRPGWSCRVSNVIYPHLLRSIATEMRATRVERVTPAGHRLRVNVNNGKFLFASEPVTNKMQFAPNPKISQTAERMLHQEN